MRAHSSPVRAAVTLLAVAAAVLLWGEPAAALDTIWPTDVSAASHHLKNLPAPGGLTEPLRLQELPVGPCVVQVDGSRSAACATDLTLDDPFTIVGNHLQLKFDGTLHIVAGQLSVVSAPPSGAAGGDLAGSTYPNPVIAPNAVTLPKLQTVTGLSILGVPGSSTANVSAITASSNSQVMQMFGGTLQFHLLDLSQLTGTLMASQLPALTGPVTTPGGSLATSLNLGAGGVSGQLPLANLAPGTVGQVMVTGAGPAASWGTVGTAGITNAAVTYAKLQPEGAGTLLGNPTASPASPSEVTIGTGLSLSLGGVLSASGTAPAGTGFAVVSGGSWATPRSMTSPNGTLTITNGTGVSGNTGFDLPFVNPAQIVGGNGISSIQWDDNGRILNATPATFLTTIVGQAVGGQLTGGWPNLVMDQNGATTGQVWTWNGGGWAPATPASPTGTPDTVTWFDGAGALASLNLSADFVLNTGTGTLELATAPSDHKVSVDVSDTTSDFLSTKLSATGPLALTVTGGAVTSPPLTGLAAWYKADAGVTLSGSNVTGWADQSGNGNNLAPIASDPTFTASAINGLPGINFNLSTAILARSTSPLSVGSDRTVVVIAKPATNSGGTFSVGGAVVQFKNGAGATWIGDLGTIGGSVYGYSTGVAADELGSPPTILNVPLEIEFATQVGNQPSFVINGTSYTSVGGAAVVTDNGTNDFYVGNNIAIPTSAYFAGDISEVLVYDHVLSSPDLTTLRSYIAGRYAIGSGGGGSGSETLVISGPGVLYTGGIGPSAFNMGSLTSGVLQQTVTAGVSTPSIFSSGTNRIPFGSGSNGQFADAATFAFNGTKFSLGQSTFDGTAHVVLIDDPAPVSLSAWDDRHAVFGQSGVTGGGLGVSYGSGANTVYLNAAIPNVSFSNLRLDATTFAFYSNGTTLGLSQDASGNDYMAILAAGGLVKAVPSTGGRLALASASDVAASISWPATPQILLSAGTSVAPVGDSLFVEDPSGHRQSLGQSTFDGTQHVVLLDDTNPISLGTWDTRHAVFGRSGSTGGGLGISYGNSANTVYLNAAIPGTSFSNIRTDATTFAWYSNGTTLGLQQDATGIVTSPVGSVLGGSVKFSGAAGAGEVLLGAANTGLYEVVFPLSSGGLSLASGLLTGLPFVASGGSHAIGMVPDPGSTAGSGRVLHEDATWGLPTPNVASELTYYVEIPAATITACRGIPCWIETSSPTNVISSALEYPADGFVPVRGQVSVNLIQNTITAGTVSIAETQSGSSVGAGGVSYSSGSSVGVTTSASFGISASSTDTFGVVIAPSIIAAASGDLRLSVRLRLAAVSF
jgi:hypothetical protein